MYQLYKFISLLVYPLIRFLLAIRVSKGKEDQLRYVEKLGQYKIRRPKGKLLWFHAASIGEFNAILPVIKGIAEEFPEINLLITTVTITAAHIARNNLPANAIHQFAPLDCYNTAKKFVAHWQPNLVIWTESEFWPNILALCGKKAKLLLVNARLSKKSFTRWQKARSLAKFVLNKFSLILAQSCETKQLLEQLGAKQVLYTGNLKFVAANFNFDSTEVELLKQQIGERVVMMAASTHPGEEEIFAQLHSNLKKNYPNLLTILAPRHPQRTKEVLDILQQTKLKVITRSSKEQLPKDTDILLVNTVGEFGLLYRLTHIVCMGGSWVKKGGQNFIEPAKLGNLVIFGPFMDNFPEISQDFLNQKAALTAANPQELEKIIENYLLNPAAFKHYKENAANIVNNMNQIIVQVQEKIRPYILSL